MQKIVFENHFSLRVVEILFPDGLSIETQEDLLSLKSQWSQNLKSWHSPYTVLIDLRQFSLNEELLPGFQKIIRFFSNFHMRKIVGFVEESSSLPDVGFEIINGYEQAAVAVGLKKTVPLNRNVENLRSRILIENDFHAHVMEIQFLAETVFSNSEDILILKDKVKNILRQWHTPYSLLINCVNCTFDEAVHDDFKKFEKFLKAFFCKRVLGYAPKVPRDKYPFDTVRSRHLAAAQLEHEGLQSGSKAHCSSKA